MSSTPVCYLKVSRPDYESFRSGCVDGNRLPAEYDSFVEKLDEFAENLRTHGIVSVQINVDPDDFFAWCRTEGVETDSRARGRYAAFRHSQLDK
jgi:hypothetical protein